MIIDTEDDDYDDGFRDDGGDEDDDAGCFAVRARSVRASLTRSERPRNKRTALRSANTLNGRLQIFRLQAHVLGN